MQSPKDISIWISRMMVLLFIFSGMRVVAFEPSEPDLSQIISLMNYNEGSILSYQGHVVQTEYRVVERDEKRQFSEVYSTPQPIRTTEIDFVHDRLRKEDFFVKMKHSSELFTFDTPVITERRNGDFVEALLQNEQLESQSGIIPKLDQSQYLGHSPRNFDSNTNIYVLSSAYKDGFSRIAPSKQIKDDYTKFMGKEIVEGYECGKYSVLVKDGDSCYITFIWLGSDINYNIVKQKCLSIHEDMYIPFSDWEKDGDLNQSLEYLDTARPFSTIVNSNYIKTKEGVWVPQKTKSYVIGKLRDNNIADVQEKNKMLEVTRNDPHTSNLKDCVLEAFHVWELDMDSLKLNETIDPAIFETSIIPEGIPVSNFLIDVHPGDIERVFQSDLELLLDEGVSVKAADKEKGLSGNHKMAHSLAPKEEVKESPKTNSPVAVIPSQTNDNPHENRLWLLGATLVAIVFLLLFGFQYLTKKKQR